MASEYLTIEEVSVRLRIHIETVRRWVLAKKIPAIRPGKKYLIPSAALDEFLKLQAEKGIDAVPPDSRLTTKTSAKKPSAKKKDPVIKKKS